MQQTPQDPSRIDTSVVAVRTDDGRMETRRLPQRDSAPAGWNAATKRNIARQGRPDL